MGSWMLPKGRKCPICGKVFYPTPEWVYRIEDTFFCIWSCQREYERKMQKEKMRKRTEKAKSKVPVEISAKDRKALDSLLVHGVSLEDAAEFVGVPLAAVRQYVQGGAQI